MKTAGIVCEYNPLHNGHLYQINKTRQSGATHIVCAMSGNFVQRGEPAFLDKWARAENAVKCGADLVVEIPVPWAVSGAESFARGSITLLNNLGIDMLSFGCETDDEKKLLKAVDIVKDEEIISKLKNYIKSGLSYPLALQKAAEELYEKEISDLFSYPNNVLALEYIKQLNESVQLLPVKRIGAFHDEKQSADGFMSASAIRELENIDECKGFVPDLCYELLSRYSRSGSLFNDYDKFELIVLYAIKTMNFEDIKKYVSDKTGLAERIFESAKKSLSMEELYFNIKTKNYTLAKIRREILNIVLNIPGNMSLQKPPFIKVLAANKKGIEVISKSNSKIPVITKHSEMKKANDFSKEVYDIQCRSSDIYSLLTKKNQACCKEQTSPMIFVK